MKTFGEEIIKAEGLDFSYTSNITGEKLHAIKNVDLSVRRGEFVAIIGANGSGKSTLCKLINAQLMPDNGDIFVNGMNTKDEDKIWEIRKNCGMVFQNPDNQIVATIVEEDVAFGPENLGIDREEIRKRVDRSLEIVEMSEYKEHSPNLLSGGQKQRVAIAGILAINPDIILFDEPTAMLDPSGRKEVIKTILELNRNQNKTILLITHFMEEAMRADSVLIMNEGEVVKKGTPNDIFKDPLELRKYGLDSPFVPEMEFLLGDKKTNCQSFDINEYASCVLNEFEKNKALETDSDSYKNFIDGYVRTEGEFTLNSEIALKNLSFVYNEGTPFEKKAVDDVTLSIKQGEFIGVIGHTGSGKSTLIQHFNALMYPTSGEIYVEGEKVSKESKLIELRQKVGMVFQYPEHQLFEETCKKDVEYGPRNLGLSEEEIEIRVKDAINDVGLDYEWVKDRSPFELSGGQKRRVAIAGVLAMKPHVLILDEPTAGLDPRGRDEIIDKIKEIQEKKNLTIVYVTHSMEDIARIADRILVMHRGKLKYFDNPLNIFEREEELEGIGLDVPNVVEFMNILRKKGYILPHALTIEEASKILKEMLP